jgi:phosphoribosylformimino-5-aminoimidazole carboxamide ribotide isomerase
LRVIGVVDLLGGRAVRARGGRRDRYEPIGAAVDLARTYVDGYGLRELYIADLDAIEATTDVARPIDVARPSQGRDGGAESPALRMIRQIATIGVPLWLDAGSTSVSQARHALALGAAHVIVGLETLPSFEALEDICSAVGGERVAFSLDLRNGEPLRASDAIPREDAQQLAARAASAGAGAVIVIDLARVGMRIGLDFDLIARVRKAATGLTLCAGGGVRGPEDLERLAGAGCDAALVATAIADLYRTGSR